ncbi:MAG TPA: glycosyltransferase family 87 protein [Ktedonobacterales bacterium]|nr:glycosyltransferase family 87 protein [Ktedonobacterales bacterium]
MAAQRTQAAPDRGASDGAAQLPPLTQRARVGIVVVALAVLLLSIASWVWFMAHALRAPVGQYDFSTYYAAAAALRANPHADIYTSSVIAATGASAHVQVQPPLPFTYPPLVAYLFIPFTFFSFHVAARLWMAANAVLWLGCALVLAYDLRLRFDQTLAAATGAVSTAPVSNRTTAPARLWSRAVVDPAPWVAAAAAAALCLAFTPAAQTVLLGQVNFLVLLPLVAVPWLTRHRHERWVGIAIAVAAMIKLTPAALLIYLALRRRWSALLAALVALAALSLASIALIGPQVFFALVPQALRVGGGDATLGHNEALFAPAIAGISAVAPRLAGPLHVAEYALLALLALALGWVLWHAPRARRDQAAPPLLASDWPAYAVALCGMVLLSPTAWVHHYLWLLPAATLALMPLALALRWIAGARLRVALGQRATRLALLAIGGSVLLSLALPHEWDTQPKPATSLLLGLPVRWVMLEFRPVGAVLILLVAAWLALRGGAFTTASPRPDDSASR